ncbi:MAG TPA: UxaA family hydrolase [Solirubrobacteraceae bacterium]|nr:UxaA family hydrolase [Solirubrobacteraceae bacterium]
MAYPDFFAHLDTDSVAVAVKDVPAGSVTVAFLNGSDNRQATANAEIPVGHKVALTDLAEGADVIEYGERVGVTSAAITAGDHVHVHNIRSARWHKDN